MCWDMCKKPKMSQIAFFHLPIVQNPKLFNTQPCRPQKSSKSSTSWCQWMFCILAWKTTEMWWNVCHIFCRVLCFPHPGCFQQCSVPEKSVFNFTDLRCAFLRWPVTITSAEKLNDKSESEEASRQMWLNVMQITL